MKDFFGKITNFCKSMDDNCEKCPLYCTWNEKEKGCRLQMLNPRQWDKNYISVLITEYKGDIS